MYHPDHLRYYDLEAYLFSDVASRFHTHRSIDAFDLFSIVIWKANRAKSKTAKRLLKNAPPGESLDSLCHRMTRLVHDAPSHKERFTILVTSPWSFALPMASAILTVLYPDDFTVYDYRICNELKNFHKLTTISNAERLWDGYQRFIEAVQAQSPDLSLRDKDRMLIGRSVADQLSRDLREWSQKWSHGGPESAV